MRGKMKSNCQLLHFEKCSNISKRNCQTKQHRSVLSPYLPQAQPIIMLKVAQIKMPRLSPILFTMATMKRFPGKTEHEVSLEPSRSRSSNEGKLTGCPHGSSDHRQRKELGEATDDVNDKTHDKDPSASHPLEDDA